MEEGRLEKQKKQKAEYDLIINTFHSFADSTGICQRLVREELFPFEEH